MVEKCNCDPKHCKGDNKKDHKHEKGQCIHPDGTSHAIHEKH